MTPIRTPGRPGFARAAFRLALLLAAAAYLAGCSLSGAVEKSSRTLQRTSRKLTRGISLAGADFKQLVVVGAFAAPGSPLGEKLRGDFDQNLAAYLKEKCAGVLVSGPGAEGPLAALERPPRLVDGRTDAFGLAVLARRLGVNAVVFGSLEDVWFEKQPTGIINKENECRLQFVIRFQAFQALTAAKLMDQVFRWEVQIEEPPQDWSPALADPAQVPELDELAGEMIEEIGEELCAAVTAQPWSGFVTASEGRRIVIAAGRRAGLDAGTRLKVYDSSRTIDGAGDQRFFLPGDPVAEAQVVSVAESRSEAELVDGGPVPVGSSVRRAD